MDNLSKISSWGGFSFVLFTLVKMKNEIKPAQVYILHW